MELGIRLSEGLLFAGDELVINHGSNLIPTGDAAVTDVLAPRTFSNAGGVGLTGTMVARPSFTGADGVAVIGIPAGYYGGPQTCTATDADLIAGNIRSGVNIFGTVGTFFTLPYPTGQYTGHPAGAPFQAGDDASYAGAVATTSFTDNGDGTVTDNNSGLMWPKDPSVLGGVWGVLGAPTAMTWSDALINSEALNYAGHTDWRLPNINELLSVIDYSLDSPCINALFANIQVAAPDEYWSSTTSTADDTEAHTFDFDSAWTDFEDKIDVQFVLPCRTA